MDAIPQRTLIAKPYRIVLEHLEKKMVFPWKNPNIYSALGLLVSFLFLLRLPATLQIGLLSIILFLDWCDGAVARKYQGVSRSGYMVDTVVDMFTETFIFIPLLGTLAGTIFFGLHMLNCYFLFYNVRSGKHILLATKFFYLLYLLSGIFVL